MPFLPYPQIETLDPDFIVEELLYFISEDVPDGDITSDIFFDESFVSKAYIENEEEMIFAGRQIIEQVPSLIEETVSIKVNFNDGERIPRYSKLAEIEGPTKFLLKVERTLLNLLQRLCGIATNTRKYVDIVSPYGVKILDTRKTTPGLRLFEKYAVRCGGGWNHRLNLSEGILIKDNHIVAAGSITRAVEMMRLEHPLKFIEVEVENESQLLEAILMNVDGILLDNFEPETLKGLVDFARQKNPAIFLEASGGITLANVESYAKTGVDAISIGALTHSAPSVKLHMEFCK